MARIPLTPAQRAGQVAVAASNLESEVKNALTMLGTYGPTDARSIAAWETVEQHGAIVHRQSRLLAGKSKGG